MGAGHMIYVSGDGHVISGGMSHDRQPITVPNGVPRTCKKFSATAPAYRVPDSLAIETV